MGQGVGPTAILGLMIRYEGADTDKVGRMLFSRGLACVSENAAALLLGFGVWMGRENRVQGALSRSGPCKREEEVELTIDLRAARRSRAIGLRGPRELDDSSERAGLPEDQILRIRGLIAEGFYELPTTLTQVAQRMLQSGDV